MSFDISTLRNFSQERSIYCQKNKVCARFFSIPVETGKIAEGGLRLAGKFKAGTQAQPLVTFITVVWNNKKTLQKCMESVWKQTYQNIEYIVVDGGSTDGTLELLEAHKDKIDYYISQKDNGIYDAMNKALSVAGGDLITLLNSDDWAEPDAAQEAMNLYLSERYDYLGGAGNVYQENGNLAFVWEPRKINTGTIFYGAPMLHQSVYATRSCYEHVGQFDGSYKIIADYKQMIDVYFANLKISRTNQIFANFMLGGASADKAVDLEERLRLICSYFSFLTREEALELHESLDVTLFWNGLNSLEAQEKLSCYVERYSDQPLLLKAISEAMILRYTELKKIFLDRTATEVKIQKTKSWLKTLFQRGRS